MQPDDDEEAWRSIVDNFGDRAEMDDEPLPAAPRVVRAEPVEPVQPLDPDRFVAPDPDLPPRPPHDRLAAWAGLLGSPLLLLVFLLAGVQIPSLLAYALVVGFVGGFLYLVIHLPTSPDDPFDDGARL